MVKNTPIGTETVRMERFHLVQKLYSFLDIPKGLSFECLFGVEAIQFSTGFSVRAPSPCTGSLHIYGERIKRGHP